MKKQNLKLLKLNKRKISSFKTHQAKGGESLLCPITAGLSVLFCSPESGANAVAYVTSEYQGSCIDVEPSPQPLPPMPTPSPSPCLI